MVHFVVTRIAVSDGISNLRAHFSAKIIMMLWRVTTMFHLFAMFFILHTMTKHQFTRVQAAHSARRVTRPSAPNLYSNHPSKYDRSITTFSNDGRLLQVEYGMEASNQGHAVACLEFEWKSPDGKCRVSAVGVALVVEEKNDDGENDALSIEEDKEITEKHTLTNTFISTEKVHRIDDHCLLITTGLVGDGRAVAQNARMSCQRLRLTYGETPTMTEISNEMSKIQHQLTRTAGARPLGVTTTFIGVDPYPEDATFHHGLIVREDAKQKDGDYQSTEEDGNELDFYSGKPRLFQSEPGGIVAEYEASAAGKGRVFLESKLVELRKDLIVRANKLFSEYKDDCDVSNEDNEDDAENTTYKRVESQIMAEIMRGVARTMFDADDAKARSIDLWLVKSNFKCRGNTRIRCAKRVREEDMDVVTKRFR